MISDMRQVWKQAVRRMGAYDVRENMEWLAFMGLSMEQSCTPVAF